MEILIFEEKDQDEKFYSFMGKFFANRSYAKEMGGWQFYNDSNSTWFIIFGDNKEVLGFFSSFVYRTHIFWDNVYILPEHRGKGLSKKLLDVGLKYCLKLKMEIRSVTDNPIQIKNYENLGMIFYGNRGRYRKYKLVKNNKVL